MRPLVVAAMVATLAAPSVPAGFAAADDELPPSMPKVVTSPAPAAPASDSPPSPHPKKEPGIAALVRAAGDPDIAKLKALIRQGAPVNGQSPHGETPLSAAAAEGLATNVFTLLSSGADIDMLAGRGITALGWAARNGHAGAVRTLLDAGASVDLAGGPDRAPIALATAREHHEVVAQLIERGSKVFEQPALASAVVLALAQSTSVELAGLVVPRIGALIPGAPGLRDNTAAAVASSSVPMSQAILTRLGPVGQSREFQNAVLLAAIRRNRPDVATSALAAGADVNVRHGSTNAIGIAVQLGNVGMTTLLMTSGADWKAAGIDQSKLEELVGSEHTERREAERLAATGQIDRLDENGMTLLFRASQRGNFLSVKQLLDKGANPATTVERWPGDAGWTPLMTSAAGNQIAIVKLLLSRGAPVDQRNAAGRTALFFAALYGRAAVVDMLVAAGADPRASDESGQTPMTLANASGDPATIMRMAVSVRAAETGAAAAAETR